MNASLDSSSGNKLGVGKRNSLPNEITPFSFTCHVDKNKIQLKGVSGSLRAGRSTLGISVVE